MWQTWPKMFQINFFVKKKFETTCWIKNWIDRQNTIVDWKDNAVTFSKCKIFWVSISEVAPLTLSWRRSLSYRNQPIDLKSKSMDWFLYDNGLCHERVNKYLNFAHCRRRKTLDIEASVSNNASLPLCTPQRQT